MKVFRETLSGCELIDLGFVGKDIHGEKEDLGTSILLLGLIG